MDTTSLSSGECGWRNRHVDDVVRDIESVLGIQMEPRRSLYYGDYHRWDEPEGGELILQENFLEVDGELTAPEYPDHPVLLHVSLTDASLVERIAALEGVDRLEDGDPT